MLPTDDDGTVEIFLDRTPFYAESGGQVGDTGTITHRHRRAPRWLDTTYALPGLRRHIARSSQGEIEPGQDAVAAIDVERRDAIRRNHTGTHLLHWALREVLGEHVKQAGSLVAPDRLRFDFSHYAPVTPEEIAQIEDLANARGARQRAGARATRRPRPRPKRSARSRSSATSTATWCACSRPARTRSSCAAAPTCRPPGDIGPIKIVSEGSIGSNLRRIEAVTGTATIDRLRHDEDVLAEAAGLVGVKPDQLVDGINRRLDEVKALRDELKALRQQAAGSEAADLAARRRSTASSSPGVTALARRAA